MATLQELSDQVDVLQNSLDVEQEQIAQAIANLESVIADLQAQVADGGSPADRQAVLDKLVALKTDLEGTIPDVV